MNLKQLLDTFPAWSEQYGLGGQINENGSLFKAAVDRGGDEPSVGTAVLEKTQSAERKHHMESEMKTSELQGAALDWAVAKAERRTLDYFRGIYKPSTDWAQGGPIIERLGIILTTVTAIKSWHWLAGFSFPSKALSYGPTPLIAAMRCYVASKLGDEIELPEELK